MVKFSIIISALAATASAYHPASQGETHRLARRDQQLKYTEKRAGNIDSGNGTVPDVLAVSDAEKQFIFTTGKYEWVALGPTDQRGPCPGLNAFANHGYLPHNGIATIAEYIEATNTVVGMGLDLCGFLSVYGALFNGNGLEFSMGGNDSRVYLGPLGLDNQPGGLALNHNNFESDISPIRGNLYSYGNDYINVPSQFAELWAYQDQLFNKESNFNLEVLQEFRSARWDYSLNNNPEFFSAIFAGLLVQPAAYNFMYRFMANHSEEYLDGQLTQDQLKSWWAMEGPDANGQFTGKHGYERMPDNWYRRTIGDDYTIPFFLSDVIQEATVYPKFLSLGGNTNGTNTFVGLDPGNLTDGVINAGNLLEGDNLACFVFQFLNQDGPDLLFGLYQTAFDAIGMLTQAIANVTASLSCPPLEKIQLDQYQKYPGYTLTNEG